MAKIPYSDEFSPREVRILQAGFEPKNGTDRWKIYFRKNILYCERAKSGECVYKIRLKIRRDGSAIVKQAIAAKKVIVVNKHYEAALMDFLIARIILGLDVPFPLHKKVEQNKPGDFQYMVFGTEHPEVEVTTRFVKGNFK